MTDELTLDADLAFAAQPANSMSLDFDAEEFIERVGSGFSKYGVRQNADETGDLESVDVIYEAMEPGPPERRNGVRITEEFLRSVASKDYSEEPPHLLDHQAHNTFADIGRVREVWFSNQAGKLAIMVNVPNTGGPTHDEAIARYSHEPPAIRNGSVGFGDQYTAVVNDDGEPELQDAKLREFSAVNFPGGYDSGGVAAAFADAVDAAVADFDDAPDDTSSDDSEEGGAENLATDQTFSVSTETLHF